MAEHLASIFGTEKDRVNCPFYFKIGACRHGDRCSRLHNKPTISQTLLLTNMYQNPALSAPPGPDGLPQPVDPRASQEHFEMYFQDFYEDVFEELAQFGEIENLNVCDNLADHMVGNVYVKFRDEDAAAKALQALQGRFYAGRPILAEFSPVTDFREATCRQFEENTCARGGYCNFMHLKPIGRDLRKRLFGRYRYRSRSPARRRARSRTRSRDRVRSRSRERRRIREDSSERRSKIAQWNREREEKSQPKSNSSSRRHEGPSHPSRLGPKNEYEYSHGPPSRRHYHHHHHYHNRHKPIGEEEGNPLAPYLVTKDLPELQLQHGIKIKDEEEVDEQKLGDDNEKLRRYDDNEKLRRYDDKRVRRYEEDENLRGYEGEQLRGYETNEKLRGYEEDEKLRGYEEDEKLRGYETNEKLRGYETNEKLRGYETNEKLRGYETNEKLRGYEGEQLRGYEYEREEYYRNGNAIKREYSHEREDEAYEREYYNRRRRNERPRKMGRYDERDNLNYDEQRNSYEYETR